MKKRYIIKGSEGTRSLDFPGLLAANPEFAPRCSSSRRACTDVLCHDLKKTKYKSRERERERAAEGFGQRCLTVKERKGRKERAGKHSSKFIVLGFTFEVHSFCLQVLGLQMLKKQLTNSHKSAGSSASLSAQWLHIPCDGLCPYDIECQ